MHTTTHKLLAHVKYTYEEVHDGIATPEFDDATKAEAQRLIHGFFDVIRNGNDLGASMSQAEVDAAIYAALALAHSMKEFVAIAEKRESARLN